MPGGQLPTWLPKVGRKSVGCVRKLLIMRTHRSTFEATTAIIERSDLVWLNRDGTVNEVIDLLPLIFPE